jgi:hypothetical protein
MSGPRPTATVLKLIRGESKPYRLKNDRPKLATPPEPPPDARLTEAEQRQWDYLIRTVYVPGVHGASDGAAFLKVARLLVRVNLCDAKIEQFGLVMKDPKTGRPTLQPYTRLSRDLWRQIGLALAEIGATPAGRVKIAGPRSEEPWDTTSWNEIE